MANVAESTVTRVLNGGYASEGTREKVLRLAKELNYVPNALAQGLRTRRTYQIACIVLSIDSPFYGPVMVGVEDVAKRNGYVLSVYSSSVVEQDRGTAFYTGRHDGVILLSINQNLLLEQLHGVQVPMVIYKDYPEETTLPAVSIDLHSAVKEVVNYLVSLGHREIGYIGTNEREPLRNPRLNGFFAGMRECGIEVTSDQVQFMPDMGSMEAGYTAMAELHRKFPSMTAAIALNDLVSFGAMRWMQDQGLRVPEDISIVGCDDIAYSSMCNPPLTTIQIPKREIGNQLMSLLLRTLDGEEMTALKEVRLPTRLIVRASASNVKSV